ncbi:MULTISPECIES: TM2 domain-containing protein [Acetobacter]|uniref:TM2 domain-containing protein n=1 Tax=Acetobacter TaxID=434 RepID=UPI000A3B8627|nr:MULTISPECIES: TM2 domain-containing protein [Acetobacter]MBS1003611.1 TM2 domain-containing protein [Acetobacter thailandicus]OUJ11328.1 hypothetical protein HK25_01780 [Acetobacter sp. DsW_059]
MRGTVLTYDSVSGDGLISGNNEQRYHFGSADVHSDTSLLIPGAGVDFEVKGEAATSVFVLPVLVNFPQREPSSQGTPITQGRNRVVASVLALLFGVLGIHKFYLGYKKAGFIMLLVSVVGVTFLGLPGVVIYAVAFFEAIIYICKTDEEFYDTYVAQERDWF